MSYEQLEKTSAAETCRERQLNTEERTKAQLANLPDCEDQERNNGPESQGTPSPLAERPAGRGNLGDTSLKGRG